MCGDLSSSGKWPAVGEGGCEADDRDEVLAASSFCFGGDGVVFDLSETSVASLVLQTHRLALMTRSWYCCSAVLFNVLFVRAGSTEGTILEERLSGFDTECFAMYKQRRSLLM